MSIAENFSPRKKALGYLLVQLRSANQLIWSRWLTQDKNSREKPFGYLLARKLKRSELESGKTEHHGREIRMQEPRERLGLVF